LDNDAALRKLQAQFVDASICQCGNSPFSAMRSPIWCLVAQLNAAGMAQSSWQQRARSTLQDNNMVVHKPTRTEMPRRVAMGVTFFNERNNIGAQLDRRDLPGRVAFPPRKNQKSADSKT